VTILEVLPQLLPALDGDAVAVLLEQSQRIGIHIETGVRIERIEHSDGRLQVRFSDYNGERSVEASWVVNGAGRVANVD
jgi:glutathione reductase (NADPH)